MYEIHYVRLRIRKAYAKYLSPNDGWLSFICFLLELD